MPFTEEDRQATDLALGDWRQGDVSLDTDIELFHLADLSRPHSSVSIKKAKYLLSEGKQIESKETPVLNSVKGIVMLTQTCDIIRNCCDQPFVEVAPLIEMEEQLVEEIRRFKRPSYAYIPTIANMFVVADLNRTTTVEKVIVSGWKRTPGWNTDIEFRNFSNALSLKRSRFAFPNDFVKAAEKFRKHLLKRHNRKSDEGRILRNIREIRVRAVPSWDDPLVRLEWWFIKESSLWDHASWNSASWDGDIWDKDEWENYLKQWLSKFNQNSRFRFEDYDATACYLDDITALDYLESNKLELDQLSVF